MMNSKHKSDKDKLLSKIPDIELFNEAVRRGIMSTEEAQIALMTHELPDRFIDDDDDDDDD